MIFPTCRWPACPKAEQLYLLIEKRWLCSTPVEFEEDQAAGGSGPQWIWNPLKLKDDGEKLKGESPRR